MSRDVGPIPPYLTTRAAAAYCGFKTTGALRKAKMEGKIAPAGRRGGKGTWMWRVSDLDAFLEGRPPATIGDGRFGAPPCGGNNGDDEMGSSMEIVDSAEACDLVAGGAE